MINNNFNINLIFNNHLIYKTHKLKILYHQIIAHNNKINKLLKYKK
jgi:hypothetical protein